MQRSSKKIKIVSEMKRLIEDSVHMLEVYDSEKELVIKEYGMLTRFKEVYPRLLNDFALNTKDIETSRVLFAILSRIAFITEFDAIARQTRNALDCDDEEIPEVYVYTQSELFEAVQKMSERINYATDVNQLKTDIDMLFIRFGSLCCKKTNELDMDGMHTPLDKKKEGFVTEAFMTFGAIYFQRFYRRYLIYSQYMSCFVAEVPKNVINVKYFLTNHVFKMVNQQKILSMYRNVCLLTYMFGGDREWYKYKYPNDEYVIMEAFRKLRPSTHLEYQLEALKSWETIMFTNEGKPGLNMQCYELLVLKVFGQYIDDQYDSKLWFKTHVILNKQLGYQETLTRFKRGTVPLIVQFHSSFMVYYKEKIWKTHDIYETIGVWVGFSKEVLTEIKKYGKAQKE